jgi:hypothetical protein
VRKKYLDYYFADKEVGETDTGGELISTMLVKATPSSSCWWSALPPNVQGISSYLDYLKDIHLNTLKGFPGSRRMTVATAKKCPAILEVLTNSYLVVSPADVLITIDRNGNFVSDSPSPLIDVISHEAEIFHAQCNASGLFNDKMNLKIEIPVYISSEVPYIFLEPKYHNKTFYEVSLGAITGKYMKGQPLTINTFVDIPTTDDPVHYFIKKGEVLAYLWFPETVKLRKSATRFYHGLFNSVFGTVKSKFTPSSWRVSGE